MRRSTRRVGVLVGFRSISSGLSSKRIILSPFTKEFRGEGHSYEYLNFSEAPHGAVNPNQTEKEQRLRVTALARAQSSF